MSAENPSPLGRNQHVLDALRRLNDEPIDSILAGLTGEQRKLALVMANIVTDLSYEMQRLKQTFDQRFNELDESHAAVSTSMRRIPVQLTSDEAAAEYAKCSQKVDFMWKVMMWAGGILGTGAIGLALHLAGFKPLGA